MYIKKIRIRNFRSILDNTIESGDLNIFVGNNDTGKSNILKALNLFFNGNTDIGKNFDFDTDYCVFAKPQKKKAKEVSIEITFVPPKTFKESRNKLLVVWKKGWREEGYHEKTEKITYSDGSKIKDRSRIETWLKRIIYRYVPAIKSSSYFSDLLRSLHEVLASTIEGELKGASKEFIKTIRKHTENMKNDLQNKLGISSAIQLPPDLTELFATLDFETNVGTQFISLKQRGDGIRVQHIPIILYFLAEKEKFHHTRGAVRSNSIWGYEEPENNIEMLKAFEVAEQFIGHANKIQIFLTTHSPAFYSLSNSENNLKICTNYVKKNANGNETILELIKKNNDQVDKNMGLLPLITPYIQKYKTAEILLETEINELKKAIANFSKPTLFVEGTTDKKILLKAISLFCPDMKEKFNIATKKGAGYNYVKDLLKGWAYSRKEIKAMGLFDKDFDGAKAKGEVDKNEKVINQKKKGFLKTIGLEPSDELKKVLGIIDMPYSIEDLFCLDNLKFAESKGWLETKSDIIKMNNYKRVEKSMIEDARERGLPEGCEIFFNKIKTDNKNDFTDYVCGLKGNEIKISFAGLRPTLKIINEYFE